MMYLRSFLYLLFVVGGAIILGYYVWIMSMNEEKSMVIDEDEW